MTGIMGAAVLDVDRVRIQLLDSFRLIVGNSEVALPAHARRVLAYLALFKPTGLPQQRTALAERLWVDNSHQHAQASLRTAIWRIKQADRRLIDAGRGQVCLGEVVDVDVHRSLEQAERLLGGSELHSADAAIQGLVGDLLPGWDEDWLLLERERIRQVRIHALEALAAKLFRLGQLIPALNAAYAAIDAEPLRESAHAALVDIHLALGNVTEARRQVNWYANLLRAETGAAPSDALINRAVAGRSICSAPHYHSSPGLTLTNGRSLA